MARRKLTCAAGAMLSILALASSAMAETTGIGVELDLAPSAEGYECSAVVRDAASDEVLSAPTILFERGQEAETRSGLPDGRILRFTVFVAEDGASARYSAEILDGERVVVVQRARVAL